MRPCILAWLLLGATASAAGGPATRPLGLAVEPRQLMARRLAHDARSLGHLRGDVSVGRTRRVMALLAAAVRLWPELPAANRQLMGLYEQLGELDSASRAARRYVRAVPGDYAVGVNMVRLAQAPLDNADQRIELLKNILADERILAEVRAFAAAELAGLYHRQGETRRAKETCIQALKLDSDEFGALRLEADLKKKGLTPGEQFRLALSDLRTHPRSVTAAWEVGRQLQGAGLWDSALGFHAHAFALSKIKRPSATAREKLLVDYFNAMLDAGKVDEGIELFGPLLLTYVKSRGLHGLMVEAYRLKGKQAEETRQIEAMRGIYHAVASSGGGPTAQQAAELAWFNLIFLKDKAEALRWAENAERSAGDDPNVLLALGAAQLVKVGQAKAGIAKLTALAEADPYAAALLAEHYYRSGKPGIARQALLKGAKAPRSGPGWRMLRALAEKNKLKLAPPAHAASLAVVLGDLPPFVLDMGRSPAKYVRVSLAAPRAALAPGEPVAVTVTLENVSASPVPVGQGGLLSPAVYLSLTFAGAVEMQLPDLTPVRLPCPKYLPPGGKVSTVVRVDIGPAEQALMAHPLGEIKLTVGALLDPLEDRKKLVSSVPGVKVAPAVITRTPLFDTSGEEVAAKYALAYIVRRDLAKGTLPVRLRAARQTASLLAHNDRVAAGKAKAVFPKTLTRPMLLAMVRAFLRSPSAAVRAEMLSALHHVELDPTAIALLAAVVEDPDAVVRMRLIELLAAKRTRGHRTLLDLFAQDADPLVRDMTSAVGSAKRTDD